MEVGMGKLDASLGRESIFDTYAAARNEATRRNSENAEHGLISKVVKSPYGGFVIRSWPVEMLAEPELRSILNDGKPSYADM